MLWSSKTNRFYFQQTKHPNKLFLFFCNWGMTQYTKLLFSQEEILHGEFLRTDLGRLYLSLPFEETLCNLAIMIGEREEIIGMVQVNRTATRHLNKFFSIVFLNSEEK